MFAERLLTWYPGSILPYASLWHTVHRVMHLNKLRPHELPLCLKEGRGESLGAINLLHNKRVPVDTTALAHWLDEKPPVFRWSHLGDAPPWMHRLFTPGMRICPECYRAGYHSALLSLRLLATCPIHGVPLHGTCACGRRIDPRPQGLFFTHTGHCHCISLAFFTEETCRQPTLDPAATSAFEPIARWLEQWGERIPFRLREEAYKESGDQIWLESFQHWSEVLDIEYPNSFVQHAVKPKRHAAIHQSGSAAGAHDLDRRINSRAGKSAPGRNWSPSIAVYRAMTRHIRHRIGARSDKWVRQFKRSADPLHIGSMLHTNRRALLSFAEMLWAREVEEDVEARRWPDKRVPTEMLKIFGKSFSLAKLHLASELPSPRKRPANQDATWLEYHVAGLIMSTLWGHAMARAAEAARTGVATWERSSRLIVDMCSCVASRQSNGGLSFLGMTEYASPLLIPSGPDKAERRQAQRARKTEEVQAVLQACRGPCLTWTPRDGWVVKDALAPDGAVSRRQRLLGIAAARPKFWLYISGGKFVARHCTVPLQALGETAREAIEALRVSVRRHIALYGAAAHGERRSRLMENKQCSDEDRSLEPTDRLYRLHIEFIRDRQGFWKSATDASILTKRYLADRAVLSAALARSRL